MSTILAGHFEVTELECPAISPYILRRQEPQRSKQELIGHAGRVKLECSEHCRAWERKNWMYKKHASHLGGEILNVPHLKGQVKGREVNAHEQLGQMKR